MTAQHSPGPWSVRPATDGFEFDIMADGHVFVAAIPDVPGHTEANAHLIAATPRMYAVLRRIVALACDDGSEPTYAWEVAFQEAENALYAADRTES